MKMYFETQFSTVFDFEKMYNKYLELKYSDEEEDQEIVLIDFLDYLEEVYKEQEEYEKLITFRENRDKIYDLLTKERKVREGPQNLEE